MTRQAIARSTSPLEPLALALAMATVDTSNRCRRIWPISSGRWKAMPAAMGWISFPPFSRWSKPTSSTPSPPTADFPTRYPHWRFGMEYEQLSKGYIYGLQKIYELVINNDPCYAYLMKSNALTDQKLVMAHVYGHCDFFKNNFWFSQTNRKMMDQMANHGNRIRRHMDRFGVEEVENFIDACLSIEDLIDIHLPFIKRHDEQRQADTTSPGRRRGRRAARAGSQPRTTWNRSSIRRRCWRPRPSSGRQQRQQEEQFPSRAGARRDAVHSGKCAAQAVAGSTCCRSSATKPITSPRKARPKS